MNAPTVTSQSFASESQNAFNIQEFHAIGNQIEKPNPFKEFSSVSAPNATVPAINILGNEHNYSLQTNPVLNEISALSNNFDKLDNILTGNVSLGQSPLSMLPNQMSSGDNESLLPQHSSSPSSSSSSLATTGTSVAKKLNPFAKILESQRPKSPSLNEMLKKDPKKESTDNTTTTTTSPSTISSSPTKSSKPNPFARSESFLSRNYKYDAFKNAVEFEQSSMVAGVTENKNDNNKMTYNGDGGSIVSESDKTKFFNTSNINFNEFSNRLIESASPSSFDTKIKVIIMVHYSFKLFL